MAGLGFEEHEALARALLPQMHGAADGRDPGTDEGDVEVLGQIT